MKVVYIAGPFRGANSWEIEQNVREAEEVSLEVWRAGAAAICPHTNTRFFQGAAPDEVWINGTMELLRRCDAMMVVRTHGKWSGKVSSGTVDEINEMRRLNRPVFFVYHKGGGTGWGDFLAWLRS